MGVFYPRGGGLFIPNPDIVTGRGVKKAAVAAADKRQPAKLLTAFVGLEKIFFATILKTTRREKSLSPAAGLAACHGYSG